MVFKCCLFSPEIDKIHNKVLPRKHSSKTFYLEMVLTLYSIIHHTDFSLPFQMSALNISSGRTHEVQKHNIPLKCYHETPH